MSEKRAAMAGCPAVLVMGDVATRYTMYVPVQGQSAREIGEVIIMRWMPVFGLPLLIISDAHSGFASEVMKYIYAVIGIQWSEMAAGGAKGKVAIVESAINEVQQVIADGFAKGDITNLREFTIYLSFAMVKKNQIRELGRSTAFELMTGQQARIGRMLAMGGQMPAEVKGMKEDSKEELEKFVKRVTEYTGALMEYEFSVREERARTNVMRRDKSDRQTNAVDYRIAVGDSVSFAGKAYKVVELHGEQGYPVTATLGNDAGKEKRIRVRYELLKTQAAALPTKMLPREVISVKTGEFVLWKDENGAVMAGRTEEETDARHWTVHVYEGNDTAVSWLPLWKDAKGDIYRSKVGPTGCVPMTEAIETAGIIMMGELTATYRMTANTTKRAQALNLV